AIIWGVKRADQNIGKSRILFVDDTRMNHSIVKKILESNRYDVHSSVSAHEALEILAENNFDLILLDIEMPLMNGYELCETIKKNNVFYDIPIIFISSRNDTDSLVRGFNAGAQDFVSTPINAQELLARVATHLNLRSNIEKLKSEIRDRIMAQEALQIREYQLKEANATKDKFFSIIAHDLNNPIATLLMTSEYLASSYENLSEAARTEFIANIADAAERISSMLQNLLNWSRSQTNRIEINPHHLPIYDLGKEAAAFLDHSSQQKDIELVNNIDQNLRVYADYNMILTVFRNLISNAIKFTPRKGRIELTAEESNGEVLIAVRDNGVGIPDEKKHKVFKIDEKISTSGTENEKGSGLGLLLCKEFVEKNRGSIWLESQQGKGTTFYFALPASQGVKK
ncbi:MAG TPA: hybrid sensor histidine kinase/response regulator, partial [Candidatus Marinimicrobia bacterium]|nr:hybrid sensor histidine kinase/response regulator [Candidatus Neomarinimicrobiota bacterium]